MMGISSGTVNSAGVEELKQFDLHCPQMPGDLERLNYWMVLCMARQNTTDRTSPCRGGCSYIRKLKNRTEKEVAQMGDKKRVTAFPIPYPNHSEGMLLRDYFAAKALQGWLSSFKEDESFPSTAKGKKVVATEMYKFADAMIEVREEKK